MYKSHTHPIQIIYKAFENHQSEGVPERIMFSLGVVVGGVRQEKKYVLVVLAVAAAVVAGPPQSSTSRTKHGVRRDCAQK